MGGGSYEQLGYDANGNVTSQRLRDGTSIGYVYDNLNRQTLMSLAGTGIDQPITYTYDLLGRMLTSINTTGHKTNYGYDALGRVVTEQTTYGGIKTSTYDAAGRRTKLTWPDGFYVTYDYDVAGNMTTVKENGSTVLAIYAYDDLGRRASLTRGNGVVTSYGYDAVSRLSSLTQDLAGTANDVTTSFTYNPAGQVASRTMSNDSYAWTGTVNVDRGYTTNGLNQYSTAGGVSFGYDAKGNLTSSGTTTYSYSQRNQLSGYAGGTLYYDPPGRLDVIIGSTGNPTFDYDGDRLSTEGVYGSSAVSRRYVHGAGTDEPLVWYEGAGTTDRRWLVADERGSVIAVTDASGNAATINRYDEYGIPASTNAGRFQYTGQAYLSEIGLYYYKARIYSPTLGRFMQTDPIGYGDGVNWYNYVGSDPINGRDPTGLDDDEGDIFITAKRPNIVNPISYGGYFGVSTSPAIFDGPDSGNNCGVGGCGDIVVTTTKDQTKPQPSAAIGGGVRAFGNADTTPKDVENAKKQMVAKCAAAPQSAACAAAKAEYQFDVGLYNKNHPLPVADGDIKNRDPLREGVIAGLDYSACGIGIASTVASDGLAYYLSAGATLWGCSEAAGATK